jgi:heterodisulfide reductase subunit A
MEKMGIRPGRLQLEYISAAEGQKFARVMKELEGLLRKITQEEVEATRRILKPHPLVPGRPAVAKGKVA